MLRKMKPSDKGFKYDSVIFYDLETDGNTVLDVGFVNNNSDAVSLTDLGGFIDFINDSKKSKTFIGHYGNNFDLLFIYKKLIERDWFMECGFSGGKIVFASFVKDKIQHSFVDSYLLMGSSLKSLSEFSDFGKISIDVLPHILKISDENLYYEYLKMDVLTLRDVLNKFLGFFERRYGVGGNIPYTAASLSLRVFRVNMKTDMLVSSKKLRTFERSSYFGGICSNFKSGTFYVNIYDVNSMYPAAMVDRQYPTSYVGYWSTSFIPKTIGLWQIDCSYTGFPFLYDCETRKLSLSGRFIVDSETYLFLCSITQVSLIRGYVYEQTDSIFDYIKSMYTDRIQFKNDGDICSAYALKLVMNSTYGKFGQHDTNESVQLHTRDKEIELISDDKLYRIQGDFITFDVEDETPKSFPAIASFVTLYARLHLRRLADIIGDVIYCDTDSIHTLSKSLIQTSDALGDIKLEYSGEATYVGKKLYSLNGEKLVHKGVPKNSLTHDDLTEMLDGVKIAVSYTTLPTAKEILFRGKIEGVALPRKRTIGQIQ